MAPSILILQSGQTRSEPALQHKLNAIAEMLALLAADQGLTEDAAELLASVGLEERESSSKNGEGP